MLWVVYQAKRYKELGSLFRISRGAGAGASSYYKGFDILANVVVAIV